MKNRNNGIIFKEEKELKTEVNGVVFEWDDNKDKLNIKNHGISFKEALYVFFDEYYLEDFDELHSGIEDRYNIIGRIKQNKVIYVVCLYKTGDLIRLISARPAEPNEEEKYYEQFNKNESKKHR